MINRNKYNDCILEYLKCCKNTDWVKQEKYKFEYANWLNYNLDVSKQTISQIYDVCLQSQEEIYSGEKGIQFIKKGGNEKLSVYITKEDAEIFKFLLNNDYARDTFSKRGISFTILSAWAGTIFPHKFVCVPAVDFVHTISFLFDLDLIKMPKKGFEYFEFGQEYFKIIKEELKSIDFKDLFLPEINKYRKTLGIGLSEKLDLDEYDWNWITEDFNLFIFRNYLKLYKRKVKKAERERKIIENTPISNKIKLIDFLNENETELIFTDRETNESELRIDEFIDLSDEEIIEIIEAENIDSLSDIIKIEEKYILVKPEVKEYISKRIERGNFADKIKKINNYKCSICEKLDKTPYTFKKKNGDYYIEVHHVIPVSELQIGSLSFANLITLCPNHHRQIHYGKSEIIEINDTRFIFKIDDRLIPINKIKIS
jgi:predicted HNH restriction endonuclease